MPPKPHTLLVKIEKPRTTAGGRRNEREDVKSILAANTRGASEASPSAVDEIRKYIVHIDALAKVDIIAILYILPRTRTIIRSLKLQSLHLRIPTDTALRQFIQASAISV